MICLGYDFAYFKDGYRYHTKYDGFNNIKIERYQRTGDNILRLVQELANAPEVSGPLENEGGAIYFDVTGLFMVYYSEDVEIIANVLVILLSIGLFLWSLYELQIGWFDVCFCTVKENLICAYLLVQVFLAKFIENASKGP